MTEMLPSGRCGLDIQNGNLIYTDTKNFGPEKIRASSIKVNCAVNGCELEEGAEINFPTITGATLTEVNQVLLDEAKSPMSSINNRLRQERLERCPFYKKLFAVDK